MNGYDEACTVEQSSMKILRPFIQQRAFNGQYVVTSKGPLARELQKTMGDLFYNTNAETIYSAEIKAEQTNKHGNFFLETWSNRARFTLGWMFNLKTDLLLYYFLDEDRLYAIPFVKLRKWAFHERRIYQFPERQQSKYNQLNDTWGRCVPCTTIAKELGLSEPFSPRYDAMRDFSGSLDVGYQEIRSRVAAGGEGWKRGET